MKKTLYLVVISLILFSCSKSATEESKESNNDEEADIIKPLSLDSAALYISNFLNHPAYGQIGKNIALGGAFEINAFNIPADKGGLLFWYCQNNSQPSYPEFFLALEHVTGYDTTAIPSGPKGDVIAPDYTFSYKGKITSKDSVQEYLLSHMKKNQIARNPISKGSADSMITKFKMLINDIGNCKTDNCKYPHGYFDGKRGNYINNFLAKKPIMVRYYYGYDEKYKPNYIRIILIGTKADGSNIISVDKKRDDGILQNSWPPPPEN